MQKWILFSILLITTNLLAYACGDGNLTIGSCGNHPTGGRATIYFHPNIPLSINVNQEINISVILKLGPTTNRLAGIMLVNGTGNLPSNDGWIIRQDPNGNVIPYNYNEKQNLPDSIEFLWILRAPTTAGTRRFRAKLFYGDNGAKSKEATPIDINVLPVGIVENEFITQSKLNILIPTIVKTNLELETKDRQFNGYIEIYTISGKSVLPKIAIPTKSRFTVDLKALNPGIYFIGLFSQDKTVFQKFIKIN
ncbi:MAG: T9SS type A sorting domain-containing protein [candidate division WOR-3 bacterium]|nr:T9SS type A sorting domain-containing protein [candidate division WOR-3 bacterium]